MFFWEWGEDGKMGGSRNIKQTGIGREGDYRRIGKLGRRKSSSWKASRKRLTTIRKGGGQCHSRRLAGKKAERKEKPFLIKKKGVKLKG